ncbi:RNA polymerase sigma factor [Bacillus sp. AK128]
MDQRELENIYSLYTNDVYRFLRFFTGSVTEAEDLTQDVFLQVMKSMDRYNHQGTIKAWILTIARNKAISHYRKKKFTSLFSIHSDEVKSRDGHPEEEFAQKELKFVIQKELLKLSSQYRMVIILRSLKDLSVKETAEILGWSESKVKTTYHRALKMLEIEALKNEWLGESRDECV